MWEASISAAQNVFSWGPLLGMLLTLPIALFAGITPGGGLPFAVVVLGFVGVLDPWVAITIVIFQAAASDITEPVPSILMGIPGSRAAQATVLDGYPLARQGLAGLALGASYTSQLIGGLIGALALLVSLPAARELLRLFGSAEFFLLSLMGLMTVAVVSSGAVVKGLLTAGFGLTIAMIGYEPVGGMVRATFGIEYLWDGLPLVPIVVGLFALPEIIDLVVGDTPIAANRMETMLKDAKKDVLRGMRMALNHKWLIVKSSLIGTFIGALPGLGGSAAHWISYAYARQTEKGARETFGKGDIRGVIAADAPNNSSDGGVLIPTVAFGIPGSGGMAIFMTMLILYGITPGPSMLDKNLDMTIGMVYTIAFANIIAVPIMLWFAAPITRLAAIPPNMLVPGIVAITTIGAFQTSASMGDLVVVLVFGVLGIFMKLYNWPRAPILIAVTLGEIVEKYLWISANAWGWSMFQRPQFLIIGAVMILIVLASLRVRKDSSSAMETVREHEDGAGTVAPQNAPAAGRKVSFEILGEMILLTLVAAFFCYLFADSMGWLGRRQWPLGSAITPWIALAISVPFLLIRVVHVLRMGFLAPAGGGVSAKPGDILDVGFRMGEDPQAELRRFAKIVVAIGVLYLGIWLIGFHVAVPVWVFAYMYWVGKGRFLPSAIMALLFVGLIVGLYDYLLDSPWNEPLVLRLFS